MTALAAGYQHTVALRWDGSVLAWGHNDFDQITVPTGLSNVVALTANGDHSLALLADGSVLGWGDNKFGQSSVPALPSDVVALSAGELHSLALVQNTGIPERLRFEPPSTVYTNGEKKIHARLAGLAARGAVVIEASANLVDWTPIYTNSPTRAPIKVEFPSDIEPNQFYRAWER